MSYFCKQCRSRSVGFWRNQMIWICTVCHYVNLYQQSGSSNLTGWKLEVGGAFWFIQHDKCNCSSIYIKPQRFIMKVAHNKQVILRCNTTMILNPASEAQLRVSKCYSGYFSLQCYLPHHVHCTDSNKICWIFSPSCICCSCTAWHQSFILIFGAQRRGQKVKFSQFDPKFLYNPL